MKRYILLFINLFIIVNSFNYSLDDFDIIVTPVNDYSLDDFDIIVTPVNVTDYKMIYNNNNINSDKNEIIKIDFNLPNAFIYNLIDILI